MVYAWFYDGYVSDSDLSNLPVQDQLTSTFYESPDFSSMSMFLIAYVAARADYQLLD